MKIDLTAEEKKKFFEQGFIGPFKLYEPKEAKNIFKQIRIKSADTSNTLHNNPLNYDRHFDISELTNHICHPGIVDRLSSIMGEDVILWRMEYFPKYPGSKGTEWHQVQDYSYATGKPQLIPTDTTSGIPFDLTVWTCFTESTRKNGCLKLMPGSHNKMFFDETKKPSEGRNKLYTAVDSDTGFYGYNFSDFKVDNNWQPDESKAVVMEMEPGECVIFSARCMHSSFPNTSERSTRFAVACRYVQSHVKVYPDTNEFRAHGSDFDLSRWGCVQVSGVDKYGHNKFRTDNNLGQPFPVLEPTK
ncbi:phytanoyl-CoA dioxygenase family protein [Aquimarina sp. ERC-38]|uniref:chlorinating enzyme n=1 Tax=Aquimarina sp. ERC-38 TaxID=2949996 RepID=UPI0022465187|nr:chlorinating enzyme [Aquimarina sp. ERC-38]UZO79155.1 phytanoyl-CoA dioxygenase family protein [Aquimarina sp. ERC-38]